MNIINWGSVSQVPLNVRNVALSKVKMSCQHLEFSRKDYQLRCTLAIVTFGDDAASQDL